MSNQIIEKIANTVVQKAVSIPVKWQHRIASSQPYKLDGQELLPEIRLALWLMNNLGGRSFEDFPPQEARKRVDAESRIFSGKAIEMAEIVNRTIPGPAGQIPVRLYRPKITSTSLLTDGRLPMIVYYHGGGWVVGSLDSHDSFCRYLADKCQALVMAVDYRLAPEHRFPAAVDDCYAAFEWSFNEAKSLGVDSSRIAVAGDSAGGNLSAVVAQQTVVKDGPQPKLQVLIFPAVDFTADYKSYQLFPEGFFLTKKQMDWYTKNYIGNSDRGDIRISPLLASDDILRRVCRAYITTAGFDVLRDEGEAYAKRLQSLGVNVRLVRNGNLIHSWVNAIGLTPAINEAGAVLVKEIISGLG